MHLSEPRIYTVVLQPTPFCNIRCKYCYLPQRDDTSVMNLQTISASFEKVFSSSFAADQLTIIWHAGEPMVLPPSYYETAFAVIESLRPAHVTVQHSFQTNGTRLTLDWCELIRRWKVGVGVSLDGPRRLHDANRVTRAGKGTFDRTMRGIRLLQQEAIPFHVISVLSDQALGCPEELLAFYLGEGIEDVCFNVEESEGQHVSTLMSEPREHSQARFQAFLQRFWTLARAAEKIHFIREIEGLLPRIFRPEETRIGNDQVEPLAMLNVDCKGNVSTFSPELLGYKNERYSDFIIGNVHQHTLQQMLDSSALRTMMADIGAGVDACRAECGYFSICGGGAPVNKLSENGSFQSTRTSYCNLVQITPANLILAAVDQLELASV